MERFRHLLISFDATRFIVDAKTRAEWSQTWEAINGELHGNTLAVNGEMIKLIHDSSHNQQIIAQSVVEIEDQAAKKILQLEATLDSMALASADGEPDSHSGNQPGKRSRETGNRSSHSSLASDSDSTIFAPNGLPDDEEADEHLRDWFTNHLAYPFPDKPTKSTLSLTTGLDIRQLNTWFINMRRRSGWTDYLRSYASGNKQRFVEMLSVALRGEGDEKLQEVVQGMKRYVERRPRGKVGDWLLDILDDGTTTNEPRVAKRRRLVRPAKARPEDPRLALPEYTLAPPKAPDQAERADTPINSVIEQDVSSTANEDPKDPVDESSTPTKTLQPNNSKSRKIKSYDFSIGKSDGPIKTPPRRRPTATCRPSPLRTVSTASSSSVQDVDQVLRSVSGSSSTVSSNVSSDLNFSFPVYTQSPLSNLPLQLPQPVQYPSQHVFPFGAPEAITYGFNPGLPQMHMPSFHPSTSYAHPSALYPPIQLAPSTYAHQPFAYPTSEMRFTENFGSMKRGFEDVAGGGEERVFKVPRM